ncbi:MAG: hypothetical protein LUF30_11590, partial [Lachnospiraceae bacterium]|nr:hypothetical protein [Lachnospiraceae bacterium]
MKRYWNHIVRSTEKRVGDFLAGQVREPAKSISRTKDEDAHALQSKIAGITRRGISRPKGEDATRRGQDVPPMETLCVGSAANVGGLDC